MKKILIRVREAWEFLLCTYWDHHTYVEQKVSKHTSNYYCKYCGDSFGCTTRGPFEVTLSNKTLSKEKRK